MSEQEPGPAASRAQRRGWTRRRVLALASLGGLVILVPVRFRGYGNLDGYEGLQHLGATRGAVMASAIDALLPDIASRSPADSTERVQFLDGYLDGIDPDQADRIGQLLFALEHLTLPFGGHVLRFTRLSLAERREVMDGWRTSSMGLRRLGYRALCGLAFMSHYRTQFAFESIGYAGPLVRGAPPEAPGQALYDSLLAGDGVEPAFQ
jgi:hypothetical protein